MIQRIQHLYMLLIAAICLWFLFTPILSGHLLMQEQTSYSLTATGFFITYEGGGIEPREDFAYLSIILGAIAGLSFINIFLYRNRNLQNALCLFSYPLIVALDYSVANEWFSQLDEQIPIDSITFASVFKLFLLGSLLLLNFLAMRSLRKDEELIRSADRIR